MLVDSGFVYAVYSVKDKHHEKAMGILTSLPPNVDFLLPTITLVEVAYLLNVKVGYHAIPSFVKQMQRSRFDFEYLVEDDLVRIQALMEQYADVRLDFVDAAIVAMAERLNVRHILTVDQRDFRIIRPHHCNHFELWP